MPFNLKPFYLKKTISSYDLSVIATLRFLNTFIKSITLSWFPLNEYFQYLRVLYIVFLLKMNFLYNKNVSLIGINNNVVEEYFIMVVIYKSFYA